MNFPSHVYAGAADLEAMLSLIEKMRRRGEKVSPIATDLLKNWLLQRCK